MKSCDYNNKKVGEVIRIEWNQETGTVYVVLDILDPSLKARILHNNDFKDMIVLNGKDAIIVASEEE